MIFEEFKLDPSGSAEILEMKIQLFFSLFISLILLSNTTLSNHLYSFKFFGNMLLLLLLILFTLTVLIKDQFQNFFPLSNSPFSEMILPKEVEK